MRISIAFLAQLILLYSCKKEATQQNGPSLPSVVSITPSSGQPGTLITIAGTNFSNVINENTVKFNGITAIVTSASASSLVAKVPIGAGSGAVAVTTPQGTSSGLAFSYLPDIYVGGMEAVGTNSVAKYWKNGTPTSVTDGTRNVYAYSMALSGEDIFLAGSEPNANGIAIAKYWKNGIATILSDGIANAGARCIFVSGNDVYVAGSVSNGTHSIATYWKNGTKMALTDGTRNGGANCIFVSGNDVYVAGYEDAGNGARVAKYWKNNAPVTLTNNTNIDYEAMQIGIAGNDVHVVIYAWDGSTNTYQYWKNGTSTVINGATQIDQLLIAGENIYLAGRKSKIAAYWKNGVAVPLTDGTYVAFAHSITLYGTDVYVTGNEYNGSKRIGKIWKNGVPTNITDGNNDVWPWSIIVR